MRRVCLAIGVGNAENLSPLPGAITAAENVGEWARRSGFDHVIVVTDGKQPVTVEHLKRALVELLADDGAGIETFILHFAGHGFRQAAEQNLWLLSDWHSQLRAVAVEVLKTRLYRHGIRNLTIFSDACRALPNDIEITQLSTDAILGQGPYDPQPPIIDRYNAVVDGQSAYMIPGDRFSDARCVFSGALIEGLWGRREDAFDKYIPGKVTSESLDLFLKQRLRELEERYRLKCQPDNLPGTPRDHLIYFDSADAMAENIPAVFEWPVPIWERQQVPTNENVGAALDGLHDVLGEEFGDNNPGIDTTQPLPELPPDANWALEDLARARLILMEIVGGSPEEEKHARWNVSRAQAEVERLAVDQVKLKSAQRIEKSFEVTIPESSKGISLVVLGGVVSRVWSRSSATLVGGVGHISVRLTVTGAEQVLIEFDDGIFASAIVYEDLVTVLSRDETGVIGWACVKDWDDPYADLQFTVRSIARLQAGDWSADKVDELAVELRRTKHVNPVTGAIAAYLYDYRGDLDSVRRMAYFYATYAQAIPFDIAFTGLLATVPGHNGLRPTRIPAVPARPLANRTTELPDWVTQETPEAEGMVAGSWPWLRQGWDFVANPEPAEEATAAMIQELRRYILPSAFTSFDRRGGELAVSMLDLESTK